MGKKKPVISEEESEDEQYVVEVIKAARVEEDLSWKYLVGWANYDSADDTWEPVEHLDGCKRLLKGFWEDVGLDNKDYFPGAILKATPSWIKRQKKLNSDTLHDHVDTSEGDDEAEDASKASSSRVKAEPPAKLNDKKDNKTSGKRRGRPPKIKPQRRSSSVDSDERPLSRAKTKVKSKKTARIVTSDDGEDEPLASQSKTQTKLKLKIPRLPRKNVIESEAGRDSDSESDDGSLFSEPGRKSSPEVALGKVVPKVIPRTTGSTIPNKRPSVDDTFTGPRKRQVMEMAMPITGTAGNATKARLAQRVPQVPAQPAVPASRMPTQPKTDLSKLSFKKINKTNAEPSPTSPATSSPIIPQIPRRNASFSEHRQSPVPLAPSTSATDTHSPVTTGASPVVVGSRPILSIPRRNPSVQLQSPVLDTMAQANEFLADIMPQAMSAPLQDGATAKMPPPPAPVRTAPIKPSALPRIPKRWKWSGDLFMDVSQDKAEQVCEILLSDSTDPLPNGLRFSICLTGDNIRLSAFHDLGSLPLFLLASTRPQQFAKLGPREDKDADAIQALGTYMKKRSLFAFAHLYMNDASVALLVVYPTGHEISTNILKVPSTLPADTPLQAALVPWELTSREFRSEAWKPRRPTQELTLDVQLKPIVDAKDTKASSKRRYHQALHILGFSKSLHDFMARMPRQYCIWGDAVGTTSANSSFETLLLKKVLSEYKAVDVGYKAEVRIIFVHVGGLASLRHMPALAERRMKPGFRFMTYGSHPSVPRERWGMREVFPLGGIMTFTPNAIIQNHFRLFQHIKKVAEHPTWECYVLPSVVAMVAKLTCQGQHPLHVYDEGNFVYEELLNLIEQGTLALLHAPQPIRDVRPEKDATSMWTSWVLRLQGMNARQILEECLEVAAEQLSATSEAELPLAIQREITRDLCRMQNQPIIMDNHRRFVVIKTQSDTHLSRDTKGLGFECTTLSAFEFRDDYYGSRESSKQH